MPINTLLVFLIILLNWFLVWSASNIASYLFLCRFYLVFVFAFPRCSMPALQLHLWCACSVLMRGKGSMTWYMLRYFEPQKKKIFFYLERFWLFQWRNLYDGCNPFAQFYDSLSEAWNIIIVGVKPWKYMIFF